MWRHETFLIRSSLRTQIQLLIINDFKNGTRFTQLITNFKFNYLLKIHPSEDQQREYWGVCVYESNKNNYSRS